MDFKELKSRRNWGCTVTNKIDKTVVSLAAASNIYIYWI